MGAPNKKASHLSGETIALWAVLAVVMIGAGSTAGAIHLGSKVAGDDQQLPKNPAELLVGLIKGTVTWPAPDHLDPNRLRRHPGRSRCPDHPRGPKK